VIAVEDQIQAVILATGERKKLHPLTDMRPSPMVPVFGRPLLSYAIELCARHGLKSILIPLYHLAGEIEAWFGNGRRWGLTLEYALQRQALGSAGALFRLRYSLDKTFLVLPGDSLLDLDVQSAWEQHRKSGNLLTAVATVCGQDAKRPIGVDRQGRILFSGPNLSSEPVLYDTGAYFCEIELLEYIPPQSHFEIYDDLIPALVSKGVPVGAYLHKGYWNPLETLQGLQTGLEDLLNKECIRKPVEPPGFAGELFRVPGRILEPGIWTGRNTYIHPKAKITPPVWIGENSRIASQVELGPGAIIGANVIVDEGATIRNSSVLDRTYVGRLVDITRRTVDRELVVDNFSGEHLRLRDDLLLGEIDENSLDWKLVLIFEWMLACLLMILGLPLFIATACIALLAAGKLFDPVEVVRTMPLALGGEGQKHRIIRVLNFATARPQQDPNRFGRWLKRWEFYRLPELLSVVRGQITLVGVSMLPPDKTAYLNEPWQTRREDWPVGFTGLWYVREGVSEGLDELVVTDAYYVATRTFINDLGLLLQTPKAWYRRVMQQRRKLQLKTQEQVIDGV
jgi:NDP-sugar pyrophosphorylase family protein